MAGAWHRSLKARAMAASRDNDFEIPRTHIFATSGSPTLCLNVTRNCEIGANLKLERRERARDHRVIFLSPVDAGAARDEVIRAAKMTVREASFLVNDAYQRETKMMHYALPSSWIRFKTIDDWQHQTQEDRLWPESKV